MARSRSVSDIAARLPGWSMTCKHCRSGHRAGGLGGVTSGFLVAHDAGALRRVAALALMLSACGSANKAGTVSSSGSATTSTGSADVGLDDSDLKPLDSASSQMDQNLKSADNGLAQTES